MGKRDERYHYVGQTEPARRAYRRDMRVAGLVHDLGKVTPLYRPRGPPPPVPRGHRPAPPRPV